MMDIDVIINEIKDKSQYRTRYAGQEPRRDEMLVGEIERLRQELAAEREAVRVLADEAKVWRRLADFAEDSSWKEAWGDVGEDCCHAECRTDANPIASAAIAKGNG